MMSGSTSPRPRCFFADALDEISKDGRRPDRARSHFCNAHARAREAQADGLCRQSDADSQRRHKRYPCGYLPPFCAIAGVWLFSPPNPSFAAASSLPRLAYAGRSHSRTFPVFGVPIPLRVSGTSALSPKGGILSNCFGCFKLAPVVGRKNLSTTQDATASPSVAVSAVATALECSSWRRIRQRTPYPPIVSWS